MRKRIKKGMWVVLGLVILILLAFFIATPIVENTIKTKIAEQIPDHVKLSPYELSVSLVGRSVEIKNIKLTQKDSLFSTNKEFISVEKLSVEGIHFFKLLLSDEVSIKNILIETPIIRLDKNTRFNRLSNGKQSKGSSFSSFSIEHFQLKNLDAILYENDTVSYAKLEKGFLSIKDLEINKETLSGQLPFRYSDYEVETGFLSLNLNRYDQLTLAGITLQEGLLNLDNFSIKTRYDKLSLSQNIENERDYVDLTIEEISVKEFQINEKNDSIWVSSDEMHFVKPSADIYRDKLVADDLSVKPLYSKSLRSLPFLLSVQSVFIDQAAIVYEEKTHANHPPGKIYFSDFNAEITHLSNIAQQTSKETAIEVDAIFMDNTKLQATWSFDVQKPNDAFVFKGDLGRLEAGQLNSFTKPNLNVSLEGVLDKTYFTIDANNTTSTIEMQLKYEDFKVDILNKQNQKNKFLSAVTNIFVKKKSARQNQDYKEGSATVERNVDKSVFNYIWINLKAGLKDIMLGL